MTAKLWFDIINQIAKLSKICKMWFTYQYFNLAKCTRESVPVKHKFNLRKMCFIFI